MIIVLKAIQAAPTIEALKQHFGSNHDIFVHNNRIAIQNITPDDLTPTKQAAAEEIITKVPAAVQASRLFHPEDTIIKTPHATISNNNLTLMAGPCSVESELHILKMAQVVKAAGATVLRGGAFKPRTSPYSFQGLVKEGLIALRNATDRLELDVVTEVMDVEQVPLVEAYTDIFQIGARNMQNFSLLKAVGKTRKPVMLKRGMSATVDDVLNATEYIAAGGNHQIMIVERGIRTFDNKYTRNTFDVGVIPVLQKLTHYPVIADPSHAAGHTEFVTPLALAGVAAGANGLIVEIHDDPAHAFSDGAQALKPNEFNEMVVKTNAVRQALQSIE